METSPFSFSLETLEDSIRLELTLIKRAWFPGIGYSWKKLSQSETSELQAA